MNKKVASKIASTERPIIALSAESAQKALAFITGCEHCSPSASMPFERLLDHVVPDQGSVASYVLGEAILCAFCEAPITEATLVEVDHVPSESPSLAWYEPPLPQTEVVLVDEAMLVKAQTLMAACERCSENADAVISFDYLLDAVTDSDPSETEYLMCRRARCPQCEHLVTEKTFVIPR